MDCTLYPGFHCTLYSEILTEGRKDLISTVPDKKYFAFTREGKSSRAINVNLYDPDIMVVMLLIFSYLSV